VESFWFGNLPPSEKEKKEKDIKAELPTRKKGRNADVAGGEN
jgi:hypothetical protein